MCESSVGVVRRAISRADRRAVRRGVESVGLVGPVLSVPLWC
jgi:hypothetical protein